MPSITSLGHSSFLAEGRGTTRILIDPVLGSGFLDEVVEIWPTRSIDVSQLTGLTCIIITHAHPGHLDIASLALLDPSTPVLHVEDPSINLVLDLLEFSSRQIIAPNDVVDFGDLQCFFTGTTSHISEVGWGLSDADGVLWHLVDTEPSRETVNMQRGAFGRPDLLLTNYSGNMHTFFTHMDTRFPEAKHSAFLRTLIAILPRSVSPNLSGFRYLDDAGWVNRYMFPVSPKRLEAELKLLAPETRYLQIHPGDITRIDEQYVYHHEGASALVQRTGPSNCIVQHDPTHSIPPLVDRDEECLGAPELLNRTSRFIEEELLPWMTVQIADLGSVIHAYGKLNAVFSMTVVIPGGGEVVRLFHCTPSGVQAETCKMPDFAHIRLRITASGLDRWRRGVISYFRAYFELRSHSSLSRIFRSSDDDIGVECLDPSVNHRDGIDGRDPVSLLLNGDVEKVYHQWIRREVARHTGKVLCA